MVNAFKVPNLLYNFLYKRAPNNKRVDTENGSKIKTARGNR